jgi:hypothetical protein
MMSFDSCVRLRIGAIAKADYRQGRLMFGSLHRHEAIVATRRYWPADIGHHHHFAGIFFLLVWAPVRTI